MVDGVQIDFLFLKEMSWRDREEEIEEQKKLKLSNASLFNYFYKKESEKMQRVFVVISFSRVQQSEVNKNYQATSTTYQRTAHKYNEDTPTKQLINSIATLKNIYCH